MLGGVRELSIILVDGVGAWWGRLACSRAGRVSGAAALRQVPEGLDSLGLRLEECETTPTGSADKKINRT